MASSTTQAAGQISKNWRLCAASDLIVSGTLHVPKETLAPASRVEDRYLKAIVDVTETFKGAPSKTVVISYYGKDEPYAPPISKLIERDNKSVLLFLITVPDPNSTGTNEYFADYTPDALQTPSPTASADMRTEVARQESVLRAWKPHPLWPHEDKVGELIAKTQDAANETKAFEGLELLGRDAAPAIADLMDDRRQLPIQNIDLRNPPGAFEAYRHYGPKLVVDAMSAILNQIDGANFGDIENGGTNLQRQLAVDGWRIYADMRMNHPEAFQ